MATLLVAGMGRPSAQVHTPVSEASAKHLPSARKSKWIIIPILQVLKVQRGDTLCLKSHSIRGRAETFRTPTPIPFLPLMSKIRDVLPTFKAEMPPE